MLYGSTVCVSELKEYHAELLLRNVILPLTSKVVVIWMDSIAITSSLKPKIKEPNGEEIERCINNRVFGLVPDYEVL